MYELRSRTPKKSQKKFRYLYETVSKSNMKTRYELGVDHLKVAGEVFCYSLFRMDVLGERQNEACVC